MHHATRGSLSTQAREEAMMLARNAYRQVFGNAEFKAPRLSVLADALERAAQSSEFAGLSPQRKFEAAVDLVHSQSKLDRLREMVDSLMNNPSTLGRQVVARATRGEDLLGLALEAHLPVRSVSGAQAITA